MDIVVTNGRVVTLDESLGIIENGAVSIHGSQIKTVGKKSAVKTTKTDRIIDAGGGIIMPGLVNCHTHGTTTLFRGLADDRPQMDWLDSYLFPDHPNLVREFILKGARLACLEMILSGTTSFCDFYPFGDMIAQASREAGLRAVIGEVLYQGDSPSYGSPEKGLPHVAAMMERWKTSPRITVAVALHTSSLNSPELMKKAAKLAKENLSPLIMTIARTRREAEQIKKTRGKTAVAFLESLGILSPNLIACHSVHLTQGDIELFRRHDVKMVHCPESNMKLASGLAPVPELIKQGVCVGLGTGACPDNNDLDLFLEMDSAAKLHKVFSRDPEALDAETCLKMATINGARALGLYTGSITPGKHADIIVVDTSKPHLQPMYNPYSHLVYSASGHDVSTAIIDGRIIMENREILTLDNRRVMEDAKAASLELHNSCNKRGLTFNTEFDLMTSDMAVPGIALHEH